MYEEEYQRLEMFCKSIRVDLLTTSEMFAFQLSERPSRRMVYIRLGCRHRCVSYKPAFQVYNMESNQCRMCNSGDRVEFADKALEDIRNGLITEDQWSAIDEDAELLMCLRSKARTNECDLSDIVEQWIDQDGHCKECEEEMFPTLSTRSFYYKDGDFVCPMCK